MFNLFFRKRSSAFLRNAVARLFMVKNEVIIPDLYHEAARRGLDVVMDLEYDDDIFVDKRECVSSLINYGYRTKKSTKGKICYSATIRRNCITGLVKISGYAVTETVLNRKRPVGFTDLSFRTQRLDELDTYVCNERNFYHFVTEDIQNLVIMKRRGVIPSVYLAGNANWRAHFITEVLGLEYKLIETNTSTIEERGHFFNKEEFDSYLNPRGIGLIRDAFESFLLQNSFSREPTLNIYLSRKFAPARQPENEDEFEATLAELGFKVVYLEKMSFLQQVEIFSKTKTLVSLHGAALTNMLFMPDDVKIVEIFDLNYMNYCFTSMSASLGFEYRFQVYKDLIDIPEVVKLL